MWTYDRMLVAEKKCELVKVGDTVQTMDRTSHEVLKIISIEESYLHRCSTSFNVAYEISIQEYMDICVPPVGIHCLCDNCKYFIG